MKHERTTGLIVLSFGDAHTVCTTIPVVLFESSRVHFEQLLSSGWIQLSHMPPEKHPRGRDEDADELELWTLRRSQVRDVQRVRHVSCVLRCFVRVLDHLK